MTPRIPSQFTFLLSLLYCPRQCKHVFRWLRSLQRDYLLNQPSPWLTFDAIQFLEGHLRRDMRIFEYGSGGSTLFWLTWGASCVSVEHDQCWHALVCQRLGSSTAIDYRLVTPQLNPPEQKIPVDWADPEECVSSDETYRGSNFRNYVSQIDEFPDDSFDLVLIDGRARPGCIKHSRCKVKIGGLLVVDNADRDYYFAQTLTYLENFERRHFFGAGPLNSYPWMTDIFLRRK
ncbi:MAG: hypothetical protein L0387_09790 [Acidobacteria bacterium]|nr:hypothetical protein [Acidobacteriota bacterium]MCI0721140.1 hypothetical protein [Acidobacteriota bacterium]